jgi:hypothetical protein
MDKLLLLGTEDGLARAKRWLEAADDAGSSTSGHGFAELYLEQLVVPPTSRHAGRSLGGLKLSQTLGVQVVGVERNGDTRVAAGEFDTLTEVIGFWFWAHNGKLRIWPSFDLSTSGSP